MSPPGTLPVVDLESVLEPLAPRLLAYCLACADRRQDAEEAAQDALVALVQRWRRHGPPENPDAFAFVVARRRLRRAAVRRWLLRPLATDRDEGASSAFAGPVEARIELERTLRALATLSAGDRQTLLLVAVAELPTAEAARVMNLSVSAVKMRVHRARQRLRHMLDGDRDG